MKLSAILLVAFILSAGSLKAEDITIFIYPDSSGGGIWNHAAVLRENERVAALKAQWEKEQEPKKTLKVKMDKLSEEFNAIVAAKPVDHNALYRKGLEVRAAAAAFYAKP
jgi:hypothetical protein